MREEGRVKIKSHAALLGKFHPLFKVAGKKRVAVGKFTVFKNSVAGVYVDLFRAGTQRKRLVHIGEKLVGRSCATRVVARRLNAARKTAVVVKAFDVVALPAMQGNGDLFAYLDCFVGVNTVA